MQMFIDPSKQKFAFLDSKSVVFLLFYLFACGQCMGCKNYKKLKLKIFSFHKTGQHFDILNPISCNSTHVVYVLEWPCKVKSMGCMKRSIYRIIIEHIHNTEIGDKNYSMSLHYREVHNKNPTSLQFEAF